MSEHVKIQNFLTKRNIRATQIMYVRREGKKTALYLDGGRVVHTFHGMKNIVDALPKDSLRVINKGIAVAPSFVRSVDGNVYTMSDGTEIAGRLRSLHEHQASALACQKRQSTEDWQDFSIIHNMPYAFCIIELIFDGRSRGVDFIFRYCNKEMENLEGKTLDEMMNKSFYEIFENADPKWLLAYADIAANGGSRTIEGYSPEINADLRIYCFQPKPNFCACLLSKIPTNRTTQTI